MKKKYIEIQRDLRDCGIASMSSIIKYYGGYVNIEYLRDLTNTSEKGVNVYNIVEAFKHLGFDSFALKVDNLNEMVKTPFIAHINNNNLFHFVVVYEYKNDYLIVMDPAIGYRKIKLDEFMNMFTGVLICVCPKDNNIIKQDKVTIKEIIINIIRREKKTVIKLVVLSIIFSLISIFLSFNYKILENNLNNFDALYKVIIILSFLTIYKLIINYLKSYYKNYLDLKIDTNIYEEYMNNLFLLPLRVIKNRSCGEIITRINELSSVKTIFSTVIIDIFLDLFLGVISLIILFILSKKLTIILLICIIIYLIFGIIINKKIYYKIMDNINYETKMNSEITESIYAYESIKNLNIQDKINKKNEYVISDYILNNFNINKYINIISFIKEFILEITLLIIIIFGFIEIYNNKLTIVDLITFNFLIMFIISPIKDIVDMLPEFNYIKVILKKISEFIKLDTELLNKNDTLISGDIEFKNVYYSYYDNEVLNNFNYIINEKEKVFIKGKSGVGKSTICNLLYRNYISDKGNIFINNKNILDYELYTVRNNITYVNQHEKLFNMSIKDNILLGRKYNEKLYEMVCNVTLLNEVFEKKEFRDNSVVDENAKNLSGGEAQRIMLARGLYKNGNYIILDEALSYLDTLSETKIINNILKEFSDKTIIYISHKDYSSYFNKVLYMEKDNEKV